jgi:hypothetical protein
LWVVGRRGELGKGRKLREGGVNGQVKSGKLGWFFGVLFGAGVNGGGRFLLVKMYICSGTESYQFLSDA